MGELEPTAGIGRNRGSTGAHGDLNEAARHDGTQIVRASTDVNLRIFGCGVFGDGHGLGALGHVFLQDFELLFEVAELLLDVHGRG